MTGETNATRAAGPSGSHEEAKMREPGKDRTSTLAGELPAEARRAGAGPGALLRGLGPLALVLFLAAAGPGEAPSDDAGATEPLVAPSPLPEDTLYRAARAALNRGEFAKAVRLFETFRRSSPDSPHLQDAYFWEALARFQETSLRQRSLELEEARRASEGGVGGVELAARRDSVVAAVERQIEELQEARRLLEVQAKTPAVAHTAATSTRAEAERLEATISEVQARLVQSRDAAARGDTVRVYSVRPIRTTAGAVPVVSGTQVTSMPLTYVRGTPYATFGATFGGVSGAPGCDAGELRNRQVALHSVLSRSPDALEEVLAELQVDPETDPCAVALRRAALQLMARSGPETRSVLAAVAREDPDEQVRRIALLELARSDDAASRGLVWDLLESGDLPEALEGAVVSELSRNPSPDEADRLQRLFPTLRSNAARASVLAGLLAVDREADRRWVREMIGDPDVPLQLRATALNQAAWLVTDREFLYSLFRDTGETALRRQVIWALAGTAGAEATEFLIMAYRDTEEPELRRAVVDVLGQRDDDLALAALRSILRGELPEGR